MIAETRDCWQARLKALGEFLLPFLILGTLWELLARLGIARIELLPPPTQLLRKLWELTRNGILLHHLAQSGYRLLLGYLLAIICGVTMGTLLAIHETIYKLFAPILSLLISVPTIAWVPVLLLVMGLGDRTVITAVFLGGFFAITHNTMRGIQMVDRNLIHAARGMGIRGLKLFTTVLLPGSLVSLIAGLRLGIGYSWRALIGGEMLSAMITWGIGKMIYQARFWNDVTIMFVGLLIIGLTGLLMDRTLLNSLERQTIERWGLVTER